MSNENVTRWNRREKQLTNPNPPSARQIIADERKNAFDRYSEKRGVEQIEEDRASDSPANRFNRRGQEKIENRRNKFGDPLNTAPANPRDKFEPTAAKKTPETEWRGKSVARSATGRPLDAETLRLKEAAEADRIKRMSPANRAKLGLPAEEKPPVQKHTTPDEIYAFMCFLHNARPDIPLNEMERPNDERWCNAIITNSWNIKHAWQLLKIKGLADFDLHGLMLAVNLCEENNAIDFCKERARGFQNEPLVNIVDAPPQASEEDKALLDAMTLVRYGRARFEKQRLATSDEEVEMKRLKALPFDQLRREAGSTYKR